MLRRAGIAPRHYLEYSCKPLILHSLSIQLRWGTAAATSSQYTRVRRRLRKDTHAKRNPFIKNSSPDSLLTPRSNSPEYLANAFIAFLKHYGRTTEMALHYLNSGSPIFSSIHKILKRRQTLRYVAHALAASDCAGSCIRLLSLSAAYGLRFNAPTYENICWTLSQHRQYPLILEVCRLAKDRLGMMTGRLLDWRLKANYELENFVAANVDAVLRDYEDAGAKPSRRTWHAVLTSHLRNRDLDGARWCMKLMEEAGFPIHHTTHAVIAVNYQRLGYDEQVRDLAIQALPSLPQKARTIVMNRLLQTQLLLNDELGFRHVLSFFEGNALGPLRNLTVAEGGEGLISSSPGPDPPIVVSPDYFTFIIGVRFCLAQSKVAIAEEIFLFMAEQGFKASPTILTAFLQLQFRLGRHEFAVSLTCLLHTWGTSATHRDRIREYELKLGGRWPFATSHVKRTIGPFNVLMRCLVTDLGLGAARAVLELMKTFQVRPNSLTIKILIDHLIRSEQVTPSVGYRVLRQLSPLLRPSLYHLYSILVRLLRDEKARLLQDERGRSSPSSQESIPPKISPTYLGHDHLPTDPVAGLRFGRWPGRSNLSNSLLQSLRSRGILSDGFLLGLRMRYEGVIKRDASTAVDVYNDMLARGLTPRVYHVATLMETFVFQGETNKALEIMHSAIVKPNVVLYTILLQGYAIQGQTKAAAGLFQSMIADGIQPDVRAICTFCNAFVLSRQLGVARKLLLTLWPYVEPLPPEHAGLPLGKLLRIFRSRDSTRRSVIIKNRDRHQFRKNIAEIVKKLKHVAGLAPEQLSNSSATRKVAKNSFHVTRRT